MANSNYYVNPTFPLLDINSDFVGDSYDGTDTGIFANPDWRNSMSHVDRAIEAASQPMDWMLGSDVGGSNPENALQPFSTYRQPTHQQPAPIYRQGGNSSTDIMNRLLANYHHAYPAPVYTVDRSHSTQAASRNQSGWWKVKDHDVWEVLMIGIDIMHLRMFAEGSYIPQTITELWHPAGEHWLEWCPDKPLPYIDPHDSDILSLFKKRSSLIRSNHCDRTESYFPFPKDGTEVTPGPLQYPFIIKRKLSPPEAMHNRKIYESMFGSHPFADTTPDGQLHVFGQPTLVNIVMRLYYGGKPVSPRHIPIGLRWPTLDSRTPVDVFPYAGMLARYWGNRIVHGDKREMGVEDQQNFNELMVYARKHEHDVTWRGDRETQFKEASSQLQSHAGN